jgi:Ca-activated chloride channel family protein
LTIKTIADWRAMGWYRSRDWLRLSGLCLLILALARPQQGLKSDERDMKVTDIFLCLDVSDSMRAEDFAPRNRITVAKESALRFVEKRKDDRIGLTVFAEVAMTQCPLTVDHDALAGLLEATDVGVVPQNRTAIGDGIAICVERLKSTPARSKVIVLLTDGANNAGAVDPMTAAKTAASFGIKIYAIGAGSPGGGYLTVQDPFFGARQVKVADTLDEETLTKVSTATGGKYFRATNAAALQSIFDEIDRMEKTDIKVKAYTEYLERFVFLLLPGILLIGLELGLGALIFRGIP